MVVSNSLTVNVTNSSDVMIVDFSYYIIYRYHALLAWFKHSETEMSEELFMIKYNVLFISNLKKIVKKLKVSNSNVILVGDCSRKSIWRCKIYEDYKGERDKYWENNPMNPNVFDSITNILLPELRNELKYQYFCMDNMEADDIAYTVVTKLRENESFNKSIYVVTNDNDYLQLMSDTTNIVNLPSLKSISHRGIDNCPVKSLCHKILCGDQSDNISGLITNKASTNIIKEINFDQSKEGVWNDIKTKLSVSKTKCADWQKQLELNTTLIDMSCIPKEYQDKINVSVS